MQSTDMARQQITGRKDNPQAEGGLTFEVVSTEAADRELTDYRSGRRGRTSRYQPVIEAVEGLAPGKALRLELTKNEVASLKQVARKRLGSAFTIRTAAIRGEQDRYAVFIRAAE